MIRARGVETTKKMWEEVWRKRAEGEPPFPPLRQSDRTRAEQPPLSYIASQNSRTP